MIYWISITTRTQTNNINSCHAESLINLISVIITINKINDNFTISSAFHSHCHE